MSSKTDICNMALAHLGAGKGIDNFDSDQSKEANACRLFWDVSFEAVIRDFDWSFASTQKELSLEEEDPTDEWAYSYKVPPDCLFPKRILSGVRVDDEDSEIKFKVSGKLIYTDAESAVLEYSYRIDDTSYYPADFIILLSRFLAHLIGPRIATPDIGRKQLELYEYARIMAQTSAANEGRADTAPTSSLEDARN